MKFADVGAGLLIIAGHYDELAKFAQHSDARADVLARFGRSTGR
jgi:hypothetical protein